MSPTRIDRRLVIILLMAIVSPLAAAPPDKSSKPADKKTDQAVLERLIRRLGSDSYADREEAMKELRRLGKPALEGLRTAAANSSNPEIRCRAAALVDRLLEAPYSKRYKEGVRLLEEKKDYRAAAARLKEAAEMYENDPAIPRPTTGRGDQPFLAEIYLRLARAHRGLEDYEAAARAYYYALRHYNHNQDKHNQIEHEGEEMIDGFLQKGKKIIKAKIEKDDALKALTAKYPVVILHSRRFTAGGYYHCSYSFIKETSDPEKHRNDVQIQFDNGSEGNTFQINMLGGQRNLAVDLGAVDFTKDPDPKKIDPDSDNFWSADGCKVVEGHVYLDRVRDDRGNKFYVVMQVIAADKESRYMAFIWRRLPGGKVVNDR